MLTTLRGLTLRAFIAIATIADEDDYDVINNNPIRGTYTLRYYGEMTVTQKYDTIEIVLYKFKDGKMVKHTPIILSSEDYYSISFK